MSFDDVRRRVQLEISHISKLIIISDKNSRSHTLSQYLKSPFRLIWYSYLLFYSTGGLLSRTRYGCALTYEQYLRSVGRTQGIPTWGTITRSHVLPSDHRLSSSMILVTSSRLRSIYIIYYPTRIMSRTSFREISGVCLFMSTRQCEWERCRSVSFIHDHDRVNITAYWFQT